MQKLKLLSGFLIVILFAAYFSKGDAVNPSARPEASIDASADTKADLEVVLRDEENQEASIVGQKAKIQIAPEAFSSTAQLLKKKFKELHDSKNDVEAQRDRQATIEALAEDPMVLAVVQMALSDLNRCIEIFGDDQAVVRLMGIEVLRVAAKKGQLDHLETAINGTMHELKNGPWRKSRDADLTDLLDGWIQAKGQSSIYDNPSLLFEYFPYNPELRAPIATAIRYAYQERLDNPEFIARFLPYMKGE